jgi:hypothetical protein
MYKYFTIILVLLLIYKLSSIENFEELYLSNYSKLKTDNELRIIMDNIKLIFENNSYFSSKFKCDQFLLLLDSLIEDYNSFILKDCSLKNIKNYIDESELYIMKNDLKLYLITEIDFISNNFKNSVKLEIEKFIDLIFFEYIFNCS